MKVRDVQPAPKTPSTIDNYRDLLGNPFLIIIIILLLNTPPAIVPQGSRRRRICSKS